MARIAIKKYSNRRFYDASRSTHVNLGDLYDLICAGNDLEITDSKTGADITNAILMQILLERDAEKLSFFPPAILHEIIRTQHRYLDGVMQRFFERSLASQRDWQQQWTRILAGADAPNLPQFPLDWQRKFFETMLGGAAEPARPESPPVPPRAVDSPPAEAPEPGDDADHEEIESLREQLHDLEEKLERLRARPSGRTTDNGNYGY